jgi:hypothetical protein
MLCSIPCSKSFFSENVYLLIPYSTIVQSKLEKSAVAWNSFILTYHEQIVSSINPSMWVFLSSHILTRFLGHRSVPSVSFD